MMKAPILIGGVARSGTTLTQMMLDSHPHMAVGIEISERAIGACTCMCLSCDSCRHFLEFIQAATGLGFDLIAHLYETCAAVCGSGDYRVDTASRHQFIGLWYESLGIAMCAGRSRVRWGFKVMHAFQYAGDLGKIIPGAKLIHVIRDPLDVLASWLENTAPGSLSKTRPENIAREWCNVVGAWRDEYGLLVRYENLVLAPRATLAYILNWLDEPWNDAVLQHEKVDHDLFATEFHQLSRDQVSKPIYHTQVGRWKRDLTQQQIDAWLSVGGDLRFRLGYV